MMEDVADLSCGVAEDVQDLFARPVIGGESARGISHVVTKRVDRSLDIAGGRGSMPATAGAVRPLLLVGRTRWSCCCPSLLRCSLELLAKV